MTSKNFWCESGEDTVDFLATQIREELETCTTQKDLVKLYNAHKTEVDKSPRLQQLISERRREINEAIKITDDWKEAVAGCKNLEELTLLWDGNAEAVEENVALKTLFVNRRSELQTN